MRHEVIIADLIAGALDVDAEGRVTVADSDAAVRWASAISTKPTAPPAPNTNCNGCNTVAGCGGVNEWCGPVNVAKHCGGTLHQ